MWTMQKYRKTLEKPFLVLNTQAASFTFDVSPRFYLYYLNNFHATMLIAI